MDLARQYEIATDPVFNKRVAIAFYVTAQFVLNEPTSSENYKLRTRHAQAVLMQEVTGFTRYAALIASHPTIELLPNSTEASTITDTMIFDTIYSMWDLLSGAV